MVVKRGSLGALFASRAGESGTVAAVPVEGRNSVGAGDTLNGRLVHGLSRGESLADAVAAAVELATNTVRNGRGVLGAFDGLQARERRVPVPKSTEYRSISMAQREEGSPPEDRMTRRGLSSREAEGDCIQERSKRAAAIVANLDEVYGGEEKPEDAAFRRAALAHFRDLAQDEEW